MSGTPKVAREVAEVEFERMCAAFRIELDGSDLDDSDRKDFADLRDSIVRLITRGSLVVGDDGRPTYTPADQSQGITFHRPTGATLMALETYAGGKNIANTIAAMADMTRTDRGTFGKMDARDVRACTTLARLFLADR